MATQLLTTKLFRPPALQQVVSRPDLVAQLNQSLQCKLTLVSAPAGFGKTTAVSEWIHQEKEQQQFQVAWVSLDKGDNDPYRFLAYIAGALQMIGSTLGEQSLAALQSPQPAPLESILTILLNELTAVSSHTILVLDDFHLLESEAIDTAVSFLLDHLPAQIHLLIITREDPALPIATYRVAGQLNELRANHLRFSVAETDAFLNQRLQLNLSPTEIEALEKRTEGWIAGLQLAALALQGQAGASTHQDNAQFIQAFTGSHRFVIDYLVEEVFNQQSKAIQNFLLYTSILERMNGPLCDAVLSDEGKPYAAGQAILEQLEQANLFIIPLDDERRWYRYHHLFGELLRQRLATRLQTMGNDVARYHIRASIWYEAEGFWLDAFHHATLAQDIDRAERLIDGDRNMPMHFRATTPIINWLATLPSTVLDARPSLWVTSASVLLIRGQLSAAEEKLQAAEHALQDVPVDEEIQDIYGRIATIRATIAVVHNQVEQIMTQAQDALANLHPDNFASRTTATWALGFAYHLQGERGLASQAYKEAIATCQKTKNPLIHITSLTSLGKIEEANTQLRQAKESYQYVLQLAGDPPQAVACEACLGLANIHYQWNQLEIARQYAEKGRQLAQQVEQIDTYAVCNITLACVQLADGNVREALTLLHDAESFMRQHRLQHRMPELVDVQLRALLLQGDLDTAVHLAKNHDLPILKVRVALAQKDPAQALKILVPWHQAIEAKEWLDEQLKAIILQALAHDAIGEPQLAAQYLIAALQLAQQNKIMRFFIDEGQPMLNLLRKVQEEEINKAVLADLKLGLGGIEIVRKFVQQLLEVFAAQADQISFETLSERELEVLQLIASGLTNRQIGEHLHLTLNTVKVHTRNIYGKLDVHTRTQAVAKVRELHILSFP